MKVIGTKKVETFMQNHADSRNSLSSWIYEVTNPQCTWNSPIEMKRRYPNAKILTGNRVVFKIGGNKYRLVTKIDYDRHIVLITKIGTHAEYNKWALEG